MLLSAGLKKLVSSLNQQETLNGEVVENIISKMHISAGDLKSYTDFGHPAKISYGRRTVFENSRFKILVISWIPGDSTAIHNHGSSDWGCILHFGKTVHRIYEFRDRWLSLSSAKLFDHGDVCLLDSSLIHLMGNAGLQGTVSLHIYGKHLLPTLEDDLATVYQPERKKLIKTQGEAYLQLDRSSVKGEQRFTSIDQDTLLDYLTLVKPFYQRNENQEMLQRISNLMCQPLLFFKPEPINI